MARSIDDRFVLERLNKCKSHLNDNQKQYSNNEYRDLQWKIYESDYLNVLSTLSHKEEYTASELVFNFFGVSDFGNFIKVKPNTQTAVVTCIDEATQFAEFDFVMDLEGNLSQVNIEDKYILDIAGSGAYNYKCKKFSSCTNAKDAQNIENSRLDTLAYKIYRWCIKRRIQKLIVTYHKNCGAVSLRCRNFPGLINNQEFELIEAKKCAEKLATKIQSFNQDGSLSLFTALIGSNTMCKVRPAKLHNALGVCLNLDSSISSEKIDIMTSINMFNISGLCDFEDHRDNSEIIDTVKHSLKNLDLSFEIALSDHGWGSEYINKSNPFIVFITYKDAIQKSDALKIKEAVKTKKIPTKVILIDTSK